MVRCYKKLQTLYPGATGGSSGEVTERILSMRAASKQYKIPFHALNNKFHGRNVKVAGGQTVFSEVEESEPSQNPPIAVFCYPCWS